MKKEMIEEIKNSLSSIGTEKDVLYTAEEKLNRLVSLQSFICKRVVNYFESERFATKELIKHLELIAKRYNLENSREFRRLKDNLDKLSYEIARSKSGRKAEKQTQKTLKMLEVDESTKILYNIGLKNESVETEIDAIVINPFGVFLIEVKNFNEGMRLTNRGVFETISKGKPYYNLGLKMITKEYLLKETLKGFKDVPIYPIILYANDHSDFIDEYHLYDISFSGTVVHDIHKKCEGNKILTQNDVYSISNSIIEKSHVPTGYCDINCDEIIDDFSLFISKVEILATSNDDEESVGDSQMAPTFWQRANKRISESFVYECLKEAAPYFAVGASSAFIGYHLYPIINNNK